MDSNDHSVLAERLKSGKVEAYECLMDTYYQGLCSYAFTLCHDHSQSEDIVQNVFTRLWIKRKNIKENLSIKSFLYKSVYNEFINVFRKGKYVTRLEFKYLETLEAYVEIEPDNLENLISKVYQVIDTMPPRCREIFLLNKKEGLTHLEISDYLNVSVKTVEWHMTKAFKQLKETLDSKTETMLFLLFGMSRSSLTP